MAYVWPFSHYNHHRLSLLGLSKQGNHCKEWFWESSLIWTAVVCGNDQGRAHKWGVHCCAADSSRRNNLGGHTQVQMGQTTFHVASICTTILLMSPHQDSMRQLATLNWQNEGTYFDCQFVNDRYGGMVWWYQHGFVWYLSVCLWWIIWHILTLPLVISIFPNWLNWDT